MNESLGGLNETLETKAKLHELILGQVYCIFVYQRDYERSLPIFWGKKKAGIFAKQAF